MPVHTLPVTLVLHGAGTGSVLHCSLRQEAHNPHFLSSPDAYLEQGFRRSGACGGLN